MGNQLIFRKMTCEDIDQMLALWQETSGMGLNDADDSREGMERFLERNPDTNFVAEVCGRVIGTIMAGSDGRRGHIYHLTVQEKYQGQGIARKLTELSLQELRKQGISKVFLSALTDNDAGNQFWEHMGFIRRNDLIYWDHALFEIHETFT